MTFEIYKLEWILSRHTFGNTTAALPLYTLRCNFFQKTSEFFRD